jgi:hypothetical protein
MDTGDFTGVAGEYSEHYKSLIPPLSREAPAYFCRNGKHYLFTSGTTSYFPTPSKVAMFDDFHGEYIDLGNPHIGDETNTSFSSQITCVLTEMAPSKCALCPTRKARGNLRNKATGQIWMDTRVSFYVWILLPKTTVQTA